MASRIDGAEVGALNKEKLKRTRNNGDHGRKRSELMKKLRFFFCCMTSVFGSEASSGDNNKQNEQDEWVAEPKVEHARRSSSKNDGNPDEQGALVPNERVVGAPEVEQSRISCSKDAGKQHEEARTSCSKDGRQKDDQQVATTISSTSSNSVVVDQSITPSNLSPELRAYPHLRSFTYNAIRLATKNFKHENFLGEGGFGRVFKGWLGHDEMSPTTPGLRKPVAVKTLNHDGLQGHAEWLTEVNYLSQLRHENLVTLIGYCNEGDQRILLYEYMPRGSLDVHLFRRTNVPLSWSTRMRIMFDAAKGLAYLHETEQKNEVIYRDFKTSNILLDREYKAKLSDFGLAKDGPVGDNTHVSTRVMGTQGYAAPEYVMTGHLSAKSDVYSFGVVLLEMITGRKAIDKVRPKAEANLVKWAVPKIRKGGKYCHMVLVDPRLQGHYSIKGSVKALSLAAQCVHEKAAARPNMNKVVQIMKNLPFMVQDMAYKETSSTQIMVVGPSPNSNIGGNRYGLRVGSSTRNNLPSRLQGKR